MKEIVKTAEGFSYLKGEKFVISQVNNDYRSVVFSPNDIVIDIGANVGAFSYLAESKGVKKVIAVEPNADAYSVLILNVSDKNKTIPAAVVAENGPKTLTFYKSETSVLSGCIPVRGREQIETKTIAIDKLLACNPTILKVDIEGFEYEWITTVTFPESLKQIAVELHLLKDDMAPKHDDALANMKKQGFKIVSTSSMKSYGKVCANSYVLAR